jgi:hypothetical protein
VPLASLGFPFRRHSVPSTATKAVAVTQRGHTHRAGPTTKPRQLLCQRFGPGFRCLALHACLLLLGAGTHKSSFAAPSRSLYICCSFSRDSHHDGVADDREALGRRNPSQRRTALPTVRSDYLAQLYPVPLQAKKIEQIVFSPTERNLGFESNPLRHPYMDPARVKG